MIYWTEYFSNKYFTHNPQQTWRVFHFYFVFSQRTHSVPKETKLFAQENITRILLPRTNLNDVVYLRLYCNLMVFQLKQRKEGSVLNLSVWGGFHRSQSTPSASHLLPGVNTQSCNLTMLSNGSLLAPRKQGKVEYLSRMEYKNKISIFLKYFIK